MKKRIRMACQVLFCAVFVLIGVTCVGGSAHKAEDPVPEEPEAAAMTAIPPVSVTAAPTPRPKPILVPLPSPSPSPTPEPTPDPTPEPTPELPEETEEPEPSEEDVELLACVIYSEAGGDECSDECRIDVGDVVLNRRDDPRFPDTILGVLTAPRQYGRFAVTGVVWPERASKPEEAHAVERAYEIARKLLSGEHGPLYGQGYVWQAEFEQGTDGFWLDGTYFGR